MCSYNFWRRTSSCRHATRTAWPLSKSCKLFTPCLQRSDSRWFCSVSVCKVYTSAHSRHTRNTCLPRTEQSENTIQTRECSIVRAHAPWVMPLVRHNNTQLELGPVALDGKASIVLVEFYNNKEKQTVTIVLRLIRNTLHVTQLDECCVLPPTQRVKGVFESRCGEVEYRTGESLSVTSLL